MACRYIKQNDEPIKVFHTENEYGEFRDMFVFDGVTCDLGDYVRCHDNPWVCGIDCPDYIHGFDVFDYTRWCKFIEIVDDEHVNVYYREEVNG